MKSLIVMLFLIIPANAISNNRIKAGTKSFFNGEPLIVGEVTVSGTFMVGNTVYANYEYDSENYPESGTTFRWYMALDAFGSNEVLVYSAGPSLNLLTNHDGKYVRVEITPRDMNGTTGANYSSAWYGPIQKAEQVNNPPVATNVRIRGNPIYCSTLTGLYDYSDQELDAEGASTYRWLRSSSPGTIPEPVPGATSKTYTVSATDKGWYLYFEVTPNAASGNINGSPVLSNSTSLIQGDLPSVTFSGDNTICEGENTSISLTFTGTPPFNLEYTNGLQTFSISTPNFKYQLIVNTGGTYKGTRLTDILNCPVTSLPSSAVITTKPTPVLDFSVTSTCFIGDTTVFSNLSSSKSTMRTWLWNFGDPVSPVSQNTSANEAPKHKYPAAGTYQVFLKGINNDGCKDSVVKTISLGEKPLADLTWDKECFQAGMMVAFQNRSTTNGTITQYSWKLSNTEGVVKTSAASEMNYTLPSPGSFDVQLKVTTDMGCTDSIKKVYAAKSLIRLQDSMYSDDFERSPSGWSIESASKNNWYLGDPSGSPAPHSGKNAFYTGFPDERQNTQMIVSSPCFDFTGIQAPFVEMWVNFANQESKEGAVMQYIQDGSYTWNTVGSLNSGFNWYTHDNISGKPGTSLVGWSGSSGGWEIVRHSLDLSNKTNIRFRIVYAGAADADTSAGFAFDDVFIGQRGKKVLVEHFTNLSSAFANQTNLIVDSILVKAGQKAINIQYHTSFPGPDSLNEDNKSSQAARALFYGVGNVPVSFLDGGSRQNYYYDFVTKKLSTDDISNRSFEDPRFNLKISSRISNNILSGNVNMIALREFSNLESNLYITVVEDISVVLAGKPVVLKNVLKFMYPSSGGTLIASSWSKGQSLDVPFTGTLTNVYNPGKTKVIAFVQNSQTKEVYQVDVFANAVVTPTHEKENHSLQLKVYPNPASGTIWLDFGEELKTTATILFINSTGIVTKEYIAPKGVSVTGLSVSDLSLGVYFLKILTPDMVTTQKIVVGRL